MLARMETRRAELLFLFGSRDFSKLTELLTEARGSECLLQVWRKSFLEAIGIVQQSLSLYPQ